jgi:hypothetical protein
LNFLIFVCLAVLAERRRNGLENVIFDPLPVALFICREFPAEKGVLGISADTNFILLAQRDPAALQAVVNRLTERVFGGPAKDAICVEYVGGLKLNIDSRYLTTDDHILESLLVKAFPFLQEASKQQAGRLIQRIIATVFADVPDSMPIELREVIVDILERPSH